MLNGFLALISFLIACVISPVPGSLFADSGRLSFDFFGIILFCITIATLFGINHPQNNKLLESRLDDRLNLIVTSVAGWCLGSLTYALISNRLFGRWVFILSLLIFIVAVQIVYLVENRNKSRLLILHLDGDEVAKHFCDMYREGSVNKSRIVSASVSESVNNDLVNCGYIKCLVLDNFSKPMNLLESLKVLGKNVSVHNPETFYENITQTVNPNWKNGGSILNGSNQVSDRSFVVLKRSIDILLSLVGLVFAAPIMLIVAILVKVDDGGPVFYRQTRVGYLGSLFEIIKVRSMRIDAEKSGPKWASSGDSRSTRIGRLLRKTRLDEIPQLYNILVGDMSLVGPRPEREVFCSMIRGHCESYDLRHLIKPGLTGWAQVNYPYGGSLEDSIKKLGYDLYYLKHAGIKLDIKIILRTVIAMVKGAR